MKKPTKKKTELQEASALLLERLKAARIDGTLSGVADEFSRAQKAALGAVARLRQAAEELPEDQAARAVALAAELEKEWKSLYDKTLRLTAIREERAAAVVKEK